MDCRREGLVIQQHNAVRDVLGDLAALAYKDVIRELVVRCGGAGTPALIADLGTHGAWIPQTEILPDVYVTEVDAPSYVHHSVADVLASADSEEKKKCKFRTAAEERHASFSPFFVSVDGAMGHEAILFLHCLARKLLVRLGKEL